MRSGEREFSGKEAKGSRDRFLMQTLNILGTVPSNYLKNWAVTA
jgi:hypothetical protein